MKNPMTPIDELIALTKLIENTGPLIRRVEEQATEQDDLAAWDCLVALAQAAQHMIDERIFYDRDSFHYNHAHSIEQQALKTSDS
jgi:hypothetical protein